MLFPENVVKLAVTFPPEDTAPPVVEELPVIVLLVKVTFEPALIAPDW